MNRYWPWWAGAIGLGILPIAYWVVLRRPSGVSGLMGRLVSVREELAVARENAAAPESEEDLDALLDAATREQFGSLPPGVAPLAVTAPRGRALGARLGLLEAAAFVIAMAAGGLVSRLHAGHAPGPWMGEAFRRAFGSGAPALLVLILGGALVGAGTTLADGCSTGHGLTGSARLQPGSLVATACFMAAAMGVSLLIGWRIGL